MQAMHWGECDVRPVDLNDFLFPLFVGSLGAPLVYVIHGLTFGGASLTSGWGFPLRIVVAFVAAYFFSVVVTGGCMVVSLVVAARLSIPRHVIWWAGAAWPVVLGVLVGLGYERFTGLMVFGMGFANVVIIELITPGGRRWGRRANPSEHRELS
jgi:hypothetical protein